MVTESTAAHEQDSDPFDGASPNYGDVALNLPPDWSRVRMSGDQSFLLTTIGHENGRADVYRLDDPGKRHQFQWVAPNDLTRISTSRSRHYEWITSARWGKNPNLWEWDGDGFIVHNGQRLMARDGEYFFDDQEELDRVIKERDTQRADSQEEERALQKLERQGATLEDERGRPLKPLSPSSQQQRPTRR